MISVDNEEPSLHPFIKMGSKEPKPSLFSFLWRREERLRRVPDLRLEKTTTTALVLSQPKLRHRETPESGESKHGFGLLGFFELSLEVPFVFFLNGFVVSFEESWLL